VPKLVTKALGGRVTAVLLLAAVGLLIAALGTGHAGLAWGSVALSVVAAAMILRRWRRSWLQSRDAPEDEPVLLPQDEPGAAEPGEPTRDSGSVTAVREISPGSVSVENDAAPGVIRTRPADAQYGDAGTQLGESQPDDAPPGEEDTDAADLLVVYELTDEVLVVDEYPRYHLARCPWPDQACAERLPLREARELGFTPCERCRPDKTLARKHRTARATTTGGG
jgi:hypothetical protein